MEKAKLMQLEIEQKRKLPKNVKDKISTKIFQYLLAAMIIMAYFCVINVCYYKLELSQFENYLKYFALALGVLTVIAFEVAYRKNRIGIMIIGIELFLCGILSLYMPYIFLNTNSTLRLIVMLLPVVLLIYYALKSFIVFKKDQLHYINNLSDVKEILKETEKTNYIEEDSYKAFRAKKEEEKIIKAKIDQDQIVRRKIKLKKKAYEEKKQKDLERKAKLEEKNKASKSKKAKKNNGKRKVTKCKGE